MVKREVRWRRGADRRHTRGADGGSERVEARPLPRARECDRRCRRQGALCALTALARLWRRSAARPKGRRARRGRELRGGAEAVARADGDGRPGKGAHCTHLLDGKASADEILREAGLDARSVQVYARGRVERLAALRRRPRGDLSPRLARGGGRARGGAICRCRRAKCGR